MRNGRRLVIVCFGVLGLSLRDTGRGGGVLEKNEKAWLTPSSNEMAEYV